MIRKNIQISEQSGLIKFFFVILLFGFSINHAYAYKVRTCSIFNTEREVKHPAAYLLSSNVSFPVDNERQYTTSWGKALDSIPNSMEGSAGYAFNWSPSPLINGSVARNND